MRKTVATTADMKSHTGKQAQTPLRPQTGGRMRSIGIMKIICRVNDRNTLLAAMPSDWKKFVTTIW